MDRREALRKLGVGGAVAVSAPVLLDSFNVAHACSPASATAAVPNPPVVQGNNIDIVFSPAAFNCTTGPTFDWVIESTTAPVDLTASGATGTLKKVGGSFPNSFTIVVTVTDGNMNVIAKYELLGANGAQISVSRRTP